MTVADQQPAVRYLARTEALSPGLLTCTLLHTITNHSMDLKPLDGVVTMPVSQEVYDDLVVMRAQGVTAVVDFEDGVVVRAASESEAEIRPAQTVVLRLETGLNIFGSIYTTKPHFEELKQTLLSVRHRWSHYLEGQKHIMTTGDAVKFDTSHCDSCARIDMLATAPCRDCVEAGYSWLYTLKPDLLAMMKLSLSAIDAGGTFTSQVDDRGRLQIQTKTTTMTTDLYDIQRLLERAVRGGR